MTLELDEGDRQLVLLALAVLSLRSPGMDSALNNVACRIDNVDGGRAEMYEAFRASRRDVEAKKERGDRVVPIETIDLVLHDWWNMTPDERQRAIEDVRALAGSHTGRRARSLHVVASYFHFLTERGPQP